MLIPPIELVCKLELDQKRLEFELELMPKNHQNQSSKADLAVQWDPHYSRLREFDAKTEAEATSDREMRSV